MAFHGEGRRRWWPWGALAGKRARGTGGGREFGGKVADGEASARRSSAGREAARGGGCRELAAAATAAGTLRSGGRGEGRRRGLARWTRKVETDVMAVVWRFGERRSG